MYGSANYIGDTSVLLGQFSYENDLYLVANVDEAAAKIIDSKLFVKTFENIMNQLIDNELIKKL